jgi:phospholipase/carboxylesterase
VVDSLLARLERPSVVATSDVLADGIVTVPQANGREGVLYLPPGRRTPAPLLVMFHGATQRAERSLVFLRDLADEVGLLVYAPQSLRRTWDFIEGGYGPDVQSVQAGLDWVFERVAVDVSRLAAAGFSDGAGYALSLGITNGDMFTNVLAWSPGYMRFPAERGSPRIFVSHGVHDRILPIDRCSRLLVPRLRRAGYEVDYIEFDGPHTLPPDIAEVSVKSFVDPPS